MEIAAFLMPAERAFYTLRPGRSTHFAGKMFSKNKAV